LEKVCNSKEFEDEEFLKSVLEATEVRPYNSCINICYDNAGAIYEIPNYCINEPFEYNIQTSRTYKNKPPEKDIKVKVRKIIDETVVACKNTWTILELKNSIKSIGELKITKPESIRLFYSGKELQNIEELWFYNIQNDSIIMLMYKEEEESNE
jgi:hypothetical protein